MAENSSFNTVRGNVLIEVLVRNWGEIVRLYQHIPVIAKGITVVWE